MVIGLILAAAIAEGEDETPDACPNSSPSIEGVFECLNKLPHIDPQAFYEISGNTIIVQFAGLQNVRGEIFIRESPTGAKKIVLRMKIQEEWGGTDRVVIAKLAEPGKEIGVGDVCDLVTKQMQAYLPTNSGLETDPNSSETTPEEEAGHSSENPVAVDQNQYEGPDANPYPDVPSVDQGEVSKPEEVANDNDPTQANESESAKAEQEEEKESQPDSNGGEPADDSEIGNLRHFEALVTKAFNKWFLSQSSLKRTEVDNKVTLIFGYNKSSVERVYVTLSVKDQKYFILNVHFWNTENEIYFLNKSGYLIDNDVQALYDNYFQLSLHKIPEVVVLKKHFEELVVAENCAINYWSTQPMEEGFGFLVDKDPQKPENSCQLQGAMVLFLEIEIKDFTYYHLRFSLPGTHYVLEYFYTFGMLQAIQAKITKSFREFVVEFPKMKELASSKVVKSTQPPITLSEISTSVQRIFREWSPKKSEDKTRIDFLDEKERVGLSIIMLPKDEGFRVEKWTYGSNENNANINKLTISKDRNDQHDKILQEQLVKWFNESKRLV